MSKLAIDHVSKVFEKNRGDVTIALDDISLEIEDKEFVCFVGPSG
jgi:NitT/TauT family transport system ATP-binding protein